MKKIFVILLFTSCTLHRSNQSNFSGSEVNTDSLYKVYKIDSINSYYLIYAKKGAALYKIVSKKGNYLGCNDIKITKAYPFSLSSIWTKKIMIGNINVSPSVSPNVKCLAFDESTNICLEGDSIKDLYSANNVRGLCVIEN